VTRVNLSISSSYHLERIKQPKLALPGSALALTGAFFAGHG
jgi:hypothetical protein